MRIVQIHPPKLDTIIIRNNHGNFTVKSDTRY